MLTMQQQVPDESHMDIDNVDSSDDEPSKNTGSDSDSDSDEDEDPKNMDIDGEGTFKAPLCISRIS